MKVYVLVKVYVEGDFGGRPSLSVDVFTTLGAAVKAMNEEIRKFEDGHIAEEYSTEYTETIFYCLTDEYIQYGESSRLILKIFEKEV